MSDPLIEGTDTKSPALGLPDQAGNEHNPPVDVDPGRRVTTHIIRSASESECEFWFGITKPGNHNPLVLLRDIGTDDLLQRAATEGISEAGPIVLFDSDGERPRGLVLMPVPDSGSQNLDNWLTSMHATLTPWAPTRLGIYLAPEAIGTDPQMSLLLSVLRKVLRGIGVREIYLLTGNHGTNHLLNAALRLKREVSTDDFEFYVYH
ncbi:MAG: hypothetical protein FJ146_02640 [Deltaproteobacteria bacterium]|nr:hypothetical protein [Deltaproteobacteria bacterium]